MCNGFQVLRTSHAATFNPSFSASDYTFQTLIVSLSRLDYGNAVLAGLPPYIFRRLAVDDERGRTAHLRPASLRPHLRRTHQPPLAPGSGESTVQMAVLMYKATHGTAPSYLSQLVSVANLPGRRRLTLLGPIVCWYRP